MSTSSPDDIPRAAHPWRVRICRVGWKGIRFIWVTFLLAFVLPKAVEVLFSDKPLRSLPNLWPLLEGIVSHPIWTLLISLGLFLLTGLFWVGSHERNTPTEHVLSEHDRVHMLRRLRLRYEQMLAQSLQGAVVELGLVSSPAAVQNAVSLSLHLPHQSEQPLPPHTSIREAYELAQQELLILGEPGAGKSTLLLELAHHLVERAEKDVEQPLPVLLPLSSWATTRPPLQEWLSEQVALLYDVPRSLSQQWIQAELLLPLLDGLDEMEVSKRADCITAINTYHRGHLQPLVVCSRTNEYEAATTRERLVLHTAVVVQPLSLKQVDTHLANMGRPLAALRTALRKNGVLRELATTPLMLQILILTYHDTLVRELSQKEAQLREQIWDDYVQRMVVRKGDAERYPLNQTITWLGWMAQQMREHSQTIFYLEQLQPDWLPKGQRAFYWWSIALVGGLGGALVGGLGGALVGGLLLGLRGGLLGGLGFGLLGRLNPKIEPVEAVTWSWEGLGTGLLLGLGGGLFLGLSGGLVGGLGGGLFLGLSGGLVFGLGFLLLVGLLYEGIPRSVKNGPVFALLGWLAYKGVRRSVKNGLVFGLVGGLLGGLGFGLLGGLLVGLLVGLLYEGIPRSVKNGLVGALVFWLLGALVGALVFGLGGGLLLGLRGGLLGGLVFGLLYEGVRRSVKNGLVVGLSSGLVAGLGFGLVSGLRYGLGSWLRYGLRYGLGSWLDFGLVVGLVVGLVYGLVGGSSSKQLTQRSMLSPNEGIRRSVKYGLVYGLGSGLVGGLVYGLGSGLVVGLVYGLVYGLGVGLVIGLLLGLVFGLGAAAQHYMLRFWLWRTHLFPWQAVPFLEDATTRILLRRVGGGYSFIHRLLLDHFADLNTKRTLAAPSSAPGHPPSPTTPLV